MLGFSPLSTTPISKLCPWAFPYEELGVGGAEISGDSFVEIVFQTQGGCQITGIAIVSIGTIRIVPVAVVIVEQEATKVPRSVAVSHSAPSPGTQVVDVSSQDTRIGREKLRVQPVSIEDPEVAATSVVVVEKT